LVEDYNTLDSHMIAFQKNSRSSSSELHCRPTQPNQALEPTSTAVTPPASAGDRASGTRGSS
jgi:hypothetical protein